MNSNFKDRMKNKDRRVSPSNTEDEESTLDQSDIVSGLTGSEGSPLNLDESDLNNFKPTVKSETLKYEDLENNKEESSINEEDIEKMVREYENEKSDLNQKLADAQKELQDYQQKDQENSKTLSEYQEQIESLNNQILDLENDEENSYSKEDYDKLYKELEENRNTIQRAKAKVKDLNAQIDNLQKELSKLQDRNKELSDKNQELQESGDVSDSVLKELQDLKQKLQISEDENDKLRQSNDKMARDIISLNQDQKESENNYQEQISSLEEQIQSLEENQIEESDSEEKIIEFQNEEYTESEIKEIIKRRGPKSKEEHKLIEKYLDWQKGHGLIDAEAVPEKIFDYVSTKTIQDLIGKYQSDIYSSKYSDKLFTDYVNGDIDHTDPLFKTLIQEVFDKETSNEYLGEELSNDLYAYIGKLYK